MKEKTWSTIRNKSTLWFFIKQNKFFIIISIYLIIYIRIIFTRGGSWLEVSSLTSPPPQVGVLGRYMTEQIYYISVWILKQFPFWFFKLSPQICLCQVLQISIFSFVQIQSAIPQEALQVLWIFSFYPDFFWIIFCKIYHEILYLLYKVPYSCYG